MTTERYATHPAADVFPMLSDAELDDLGADIEQNGQHEDIILYEDKILDGRNRYEACLRKGLEPSFAELEECDDPVAYVIGVNLRRRHLTESQRAICAAKLAGLKHGSNQFATKHPSATGNSRDRTRRGQEDVQICTSIPSDKAADLFQVSRRTVSTALDVLRNCGTEVVKLCEQGEVKVSTAAKLAKTTEDKKEQNRIAKKGAAAVKDAVKPTNKTPAVETPLDIAKEAFARLTAMDRQSFLKWAENGV